MVLVRLAHVDQGQHHENERLQQDDRMWKIAHAVPVIRCIMMPYAVAVPPRPAIRKKISSPAYMFPNSRMPCESVRPRYSTMFMQRFADAEEQRGDPGQRIQVSVGHAERRVTSSCSQPPSPLILTL